MQTGPFNEMPLESGNMILVNPSPTYADKNAIMTFRSKCDEFMKKIMEMLDSTVGPFLYQQSFRVGYKQLNERSYNVYISGDRVNEPVTCFHEIVIHYSGLVKDVDQSNISKKFEREISCQRGDLLKFVLTPFEGYDVEPMEVTIEVTEEDRYEVFIFEKMVSYS